VTSPHPLELTECDRTHLAVHLDSGVALEVAHGRDRLVAEDPVNAAAVKTERTEALLEFRNIVTPEHGGASTERTVTETEACLDQGAPCLGAADPVDPQASTVLKRLDSCPRGEAEHLRRIFVGGQAEDAQAIPQFGHRRADGALPERQDEVSSYR